MTVSSGFKSSGAKETKTDWPHEEGLEFGTTKQQDDWFLEPTEKDLVSLQDEERMS